MYVNFIFDIIIYVFRLKFVSLHKFFKCEGRCYDVLLANTLLLAGSLGII
jgi:hypothetical protein